MPDMNSSIHIKYSPVDFDPFAGPTIEQLISITEPQAEIWLACQFGGHDANRAYNESISLHLQGSLNRAALEQAVNALVRRHEALRSAFSGDGKTVLIFESLPVELAFVDLSGFAPSDQEAAIRDDRNANAQHIFDLQNGPLFRMGLLRLSETDHLFTLTAHHIVCDGWSAGVALQDLGALYTAYVQGKMPLLPPAESLGHYAAEELSFQKTNEYKAVESFWLKQYEGSVPVVDLPTDLPRPPRRTYASHRQDYRLDDDLTLALKKLGQRNGCSLVSTLLISFEVLLHRLTGQTDLIVGLPAAGQSATGHGRLMGHCVNLLPIRSRPQPEQSFGEYLKSRRDAILDAFDNQRLTFGSLLKKLSIPRDPARVPLVPVMFNVDFGLDEGIHFHDLTFELLSNPRQFEAVDLFVNAGGTQQSLTIEWSYNTQLFRPDTIDGFMAQFVQLLREVTADPSVNIGAYNVPRSEGSSEGSQFFGTVANYPCETPLHELLAKTAVQFSEKSALECNGQSLTYRELHEQANRLAGQIRQQGAGPGSVVGVMLDRTTDLVVSILAVLKAGAAFLPLDPAFPHDRLAFMLTDSGANLLLTSARYAGRLNTATPEIRVETVLSQTGEKATKAPDERITGDSLAYVLYTSGSTGKPKGVQVEHRNLVNLLYSMVAWPGMTDGDKFLSVTTVSFDIANVELFLPLLVGGTLVLADAETAKDGRLLLEALQQPGISLFQATPATYKMLLASGWDAKLPVKAICGGEPMTNDLAQKLTARTNSLWNIYGPTETTIYSIGKQILPTDVVITIGKPVQNTQVYLVDEGGKLVPHGAVGEIYIGGDGVARGYLNRPELTTEKFVLNPFGPGRLYRTGDLGQRTPDGEILCLGRIDQQVKIRGYRIELGEVENTLNNITDIQEAVVVAREDRPGDLRLVAYVVAEGVKPNEVQSAPRERISQWKQQAREFLPDYMVPTDFVAVASFALTPSGKIDRKALVQRPLNAATAAGEMQRALGAEEALLMSIWTEVLGVQNISPQDSFFDLGGHSMLALQAMTRLEKETNRRLPLAILFECPTIEKLAELLRQEQPKTPTPSLVTIKPYGSKMPIYIVHGGGLNLLTFRGLIEHMDAEQPIYGFQARGLDGIEEPLDSMDAIAADYLEELLEHNPDGPYALAGYSFGGYIALEMARQLQAQGKTVKLLGMFDTNAEESAEGRPFLDRMAWRIGRQIPKMAWIGRSLIEQPIPTLKYQGEYVERQVKNVLRAVGLAGETTYEEIGDENMIRIIEKHEIAFRNYRMRPYDGIIDVFKAQKRLYFVEDREFLGWKKYTRQGVRVHDVPGDHKEMLLPPNDKVFARVLQNALDIS